MVLIAPPTEIDEGAIRRAFEDRRGVFIDTKNDSKFVRKDGVMAVVPPRYWPSLQGIHPRDLYAKLAKETDMHIITAQHDELYGHLAWHIAGAQERMVDTTHNFVGEERKRLLRELRAILI